MKFIVIILLVSFSVYAQNLEIRKPFPYEMKEVSKVYYYSWHDTYDVIAPHLKYQKTPENCYQLWQEYNKVEKAVLLVAKKNKKILGIAFAGPKTRSKEFKNYDCEIDKIYVLPDYKRQGIGKALLKAILRDLQKLGYKKAILQSLTSNKNTNNFYEKMGGILIKKLKVAYNETMNVYEFNLRVV